MYACNKLNQMNARNEDNFNFLNMKLLKLASKKIDSLFLIFFEVLKILIQDRQKQYLCCSNVAFNSVFFGKNTHFYIRANG